MPSEDSAPADAQLDWDRYKRQRWKLYASYAFSSWGDRMWTFAVGLALASIGNDLRLPAVYGFICGGGVLLFGASVGSWIDKTPRLTAATRCLLINNLSVALASASLVCLLHWHDEILRSAAGYIAVLTVTILVTALSELASSGSKIVISRDWVVVMCFGDSTLLANTNAVMLRINLTAMILSPLIAGQIMTSISMSAGCLFISVWNIASYLVENYLLWSIYQNVPQLAVKKNENQPIEMTALTANDPAEGNNVEDEIKKSSMADLKETRAKSNLLQKLKLFIQGLFRGWAIYRSQPVFEAGLALGLLYMTVLGMDSITTAFAYAQGLEENILAVVRGVGALVGISGSFAFPKIRRCFGLPKTGLLSLSLQLSALSLCVISVWLPGSPFDLIGYFSGHSHWVPFKHNYIMEHVSANQTAANIMTSANDSIVQQFPGNLTENNYERNSIDYSVVSIWTFLAGVCFARFGLWMADLSISQIYQETIPEDRRGIVSGVQNSINQSMDMIKSILVIALPSPLTFGLLIIASFAAVTCSWICFCTFVFKQYKRRNINNRRQDDEFTGKDVVETCSDGPADDTVGPASSRQSLKLEDSGKTLALADMAFGRVSMNPSLEDVNTLSDLIRKEGSHIV